MRLFTIGDSMIALNPNNKGPLRFNKTFERTIAGAELNVAIGASRLGLESIFYSKVGEDEFGRYIINTLRGEAINIDNIEQSKTYNTSVYFKQINADGSGKSFYYRDNAPIKQMTFDDIKQINFSEIDYFHISGVFIGLLNEKLDVIESLIKKARESNTIISLDPNIRLKTWDANLASKCLVSLLPYIDLLLTSEEELKTLKLSGGFEDIKDLFQRFHLKEIIVKRGELPTKYYAKNEYFEVDTFPVKVIDTVGAGDGFTAGYLYAKSEKLSPYESVKFANAVGAMVTGVIGDNEGLPYLEEVQRFMNNIKDIER
jgi:2-dehydro-3-deoxygluconokinase